jgi:N-acetylmuramoyl-L-alanine amidase
MKYVAISSGHGLYVRGAAGSPIPPCLDEVDEARRVVEAVTKKLRERGIGVAAFHDDTSKSQQTNLATIVAFHNAQDRDLDVSVHFNAFNGQAHGVEVLYVTQEELARELSAAIAAAGGFTNRGPKKRTDLYFLNKTDEPAVLLEICFCDNAEDSSLYRSRFDNICDAIADVLVGEDYIATPIEPDEPDESAALVKLTGKCSWFGGPDDEGVSEDEGLALYSDFMQQPELFLPYQPTGTSGLARRLNPQIHYCAARWDYDVTPKSALQEEKALVRNVRTGLALTAFCADWGPNEKTGRICDLSPGLMQDLDLVTDDVVELIWPYREEMS